MKMGNWQILRWVNWQILRWVDWQTFGLADRKMGRLWRKILRWRKRLLTRRNKLNEDIHRLISNVQTRKCADWQKCRDMKMSRCLDQEMGRLTNVQISIGSDIQTEKGQDTQMGECSD